MPMSACDVHMYASTHDCIHTSLCTSAHTRVAVCFVTRFTRFVIVFES